MPAIGQTAFKHETWLPKLADLLARGRDSQAVRFLHDLIENELPLFRDQPEVQERRRLAWICLIDLLRERGRLAEALAWVCLECELHPGNVAAQALKERLKRTIYFTREPSREREQPSYFDGWEGVAGMRELKAALERDILLPLQEPELYKRYRVTLPNGVLLYGPPGCGKTFIARALAKRLGYHFMDVKPSDLATIWVHGTQEKIGELFKQAEKKAPTMLFLDELDALMPDRSRGGLYHHYAAEVNEFLVQINECSKRDLLVIGATNVPKKVDRAIRRPGRLDKSIYVGPPDIEARVQAFRLFMRDRPQDTIDWMALANESEEFSFAELEHVVNESARAALSARRPISTEDLLLAIQGNPASPKAEYEWID